MHLMATLLQPFEQRSFPHALGGHTLTEHGGRQLAWISDQHCMLHIVCERNEGRHFRTLSSLVHNESLELVIELAEQIEATSAQRAEHDLSLIEETDAEGVDSRLTLLA